MKRKIFYVVLFVIMIFSIVYVGSLMANRMNADIEAFKLKAKEALGTDDFELQMVDFLIAKTKDGRQYPSQTIIESYYRRMIISQFITISIVVGGGMIIGVLSVFLSNVSVHRNGDTLHRFPSRWNRSPILLVSSSHVQVSGIATPSCALLRMSELVGVFKAIWKTIL